MRTQFLLAAGLASLAVADNTCTVSSTTTITGAEATALAGCSTVEGDVEIGVDAQTVTLADVQLITGDLTASAGVLASISAPQLTEISGDLTLVNLTKLFTVTMPELTQVGTLHFEALPLLSTLAFTKEIDTATSVLITNTFLGSLTGINLDEVTDFNINNNPRLMNISSQITMINGLLTIEANGKASGDQLTVDFPNLKYASNFTVRNAATINVPSLTAVNGSMGIYENDKLESFACPNLTSVGGGKAGKGGIAIVANDALSNISFPVFKESGGAVQLANNTVLNNISFPELSYVNGAVDFSGNFTDPNLPALSIVQGAFNVQSKQDLDCPKYTGLQAVQGKKTCVDNTDNVHSLDSNGNSNSGSSGGSKKKPSAAATITFSHAAVVLAMVAGSLVLLS